jgi:signal transduction histidine kinase/ActR/RegA family two-component response regulator
MAARSPLGLRVATIVAAILSCALLVLVAAPLLRDQGLTYLSGPVRVTATHGRQALGDHVIQLPGQLLHAGLPADARVVARWHIEVKDGDPAGWGVWIERPLYAGRLYWDGRLLDEVGDVDGWRRSEQSLFASIPAERAGRHEIALELQGDYGKGGVIGRIVHGPLPHVWRLATRVEAEKVALVLLLSGLAALHLLLSGRRQQRWTYAFFGLFCFALALYVFLRTDLSAQLFDHAPIPLRLRRLVTAWLGPLGLGLAASFDRSHPPPWLIALIAGAGTASLASLLLPLGWLPLLELTFDGLLVSCALAFLVVVVPLALRGVAGASVLALSTMIPVVWGAVSEVLVTNGLIAGGSHLMPTVAALALGMTASLMRRDAVASERLDRIVQSSADAMVRVERGGRILDTNPAADVMLGPRARGSDLIAWFVADDQLLARAHLSDSPNRPERAELRIRGQGRVVESVAAELDDHTLLLMVRDVTRRRKLDKGILQAARMETLAVLVGGIAHDFNNMLATLLAHVGYLQVSANGVVRTRLERMEATIERASQLTRSLLALTRGTTSVLESTSLHAVVKGALERVRSTWPERAELWVDVPESLPQVAAAASDLEQVVVNLLLNARDAVGLTGSVRLQARPFQTPDGAMGVVCAIEDDGPGVPLDAREHIFTPFFTTKARREGAGLGLAVAHQILREHHGRLWLEDRPGGGARFCFALHGAHTLNAATEPPVEGQLLYVVDDEETLREGWAGALRRRGYVVRTFDNGSVAAEALAAGAPHALITDVLLPGMNGLELTTLCRALHPDVPVLIVSGYIPDDTLPPDGRIHRLDKPIRTSRLVATVGRILTGSASATDDAGPRMILPTLDAVTWESATWGTPSLPPSRLRGVPAQPSNDALVDSDGDELTGPVPPAGEG